MFRTHARRFAAIVFCVFVMTGCAAPRPVVVVPAPVRTAEYRPSPPIPTPAASTPGKENPHRFGWTERKITDEELWRICETNPDLSPVGCRAILARLNARAHYYISEDMEKGRKLKVPDDFGAYIGWSPLPAALSRAENLPRLIVVVKDIPFLGWYERGVLVGDSMVCLGGDGQETVTGRYKVEEKDKDHISRSYSNSFGRPAWMPWAMRLYEVVYIHAGDITGSHCSHGCVTLPVKEAEELFDWADVGTPVIVADTLADIDRLL